MKEREAKHLDVIQTRNGDWYVVVSASHEVCCILADEAAEMLEAL